MYSLLLRRGAAEYDKAGCRSPNMATVSYSIIVHLLTPCLPVFDIRDTYLYTRMRQGLAHEQHHSEKKALGLLEAVEMAAHHQRLKVLPNDGQQ